MPIANVPINTTEITSSLYSNLNDAISQIFHPIMPIIQAIGIAFLVYLIFLIIKAISTLRMNAKVKIIAKNVEEINAKLDKLINKKEKTLKKGN